MLQVCVGKVALVHSQVFLQVFSQACACESCCPAHPLAIILLKLLLVFPVKLDFPFELFKLMSCHDILSASLN